MHYVFALVAQNGLPSRVIYTESGLTPDLTAFIYKGVNIDIAAPANPDENEIAVSTDAMRMMLNCCHCKSVILLMIQMIGLVYEIIKQLPNEKMRLCCITVLPYIYGDSGCGKTTISKAMYDYSYDNRFLSLATSTEAAILNKLSSVFSGVIIIDDVPHSTVNRCSRKDLDKLEPILRTYGDIGAEKSTANGQLASTSAWAVVTAEDLFVTIPSSILRLLTLHLDYGEVDFDAVEVLTENRISIDTFTICYLKWFFSKLLFDANGTTIADIPDLTILYASARKEILESYTHIREATLMSTFSLNLL